MTEFNYNDLKYLSVDLPQEVKFYKFSGDFEGELRIIDKFLKRNIPEALRKRLMIEKIFAEGLQDNYYTSFEELLEGLRKHYTKVTAENLEEIIGFGNVDFIMKNGERAFECQALSNILGQHGGFLSELETGVKYEFKPNAFNRDIIKRMEEGTLKGCEFLVEEHMSVAPEFQRPGKKIRVWLPYPCENGTQSDIELVESSHPVFISEGPQRTAYFEKIYEPGDEFFVKFRYKNTVKFVKPDPASVSESQPSMPEYTGEILPHISFTGTIKALAEEIRGEETNPLILARRVYDWISDHVNYSYVRDYLYIDNIPESVILNGYGDCGTMVLVFVTLLRCMGIPAKWQSGSSVKPNYIGSHDWAMFYIAPYGWLYCDPSYGNSEDKLRHEHYFANLDPFRLVAADEFQSRFDPPKKFLRMDPYDNQSGEAEYEDENLFFDGCIKWRRVLEWNEF